ncbi:hypothetical protein K501DRAFT_284669 [Backusella circina FSU 941]|nr:hypothetical protein K501DRAFT_284669 [Backusella circina FSU 941]
MKKKTKTKQSNEDNNKYNNYLPISPPPAHRKSPEDEHFQSSSSPVGRPPPPPPPESAYHYHGLDSDIFQDLAEIISQTQSSPRTPPSTPLVMMNMSPVDFELYEFLDSSYPSDLELFPALPNNSNDPS